MKKNWHLKKWAEKTTVIIASVSGFILATFEDIPTLTLFVLACLFAGSVTLLIKHSRLVDEI